MKEKFKKLCDEKINSLEKDKIFSEADKVYLREMFIFGIETVINELKKNKK